MTTSKIIVVAAKESERTSVFYCVYCKAKHRHGIESGWRHSHCTNEESPYYGEDYYLEVKG